MGLKKLGFELLPGTGWETAWAAAPAALAGFQAISAQRQLGKVRTDIDNYRRQDIENPFANLSNPYENLAVATQAAEMQMEQTDQALANTLDTLRETGAAAGGATAIANAALKSKQGVAASIEKQEAQNQRLQAQGQLQVDVAKGKGETVRMQMQENRDINELNRLQAQSDMAQYRRDSSIQTGLSALGDAAAVRNAGIVPEKRNSKLMDSQIKTANEVTSGVDVNKLISGPTIEEQMAQDTFEDDEQPIIEGDNVQQNTQEAYARRLKQAQEARMVDQDINPNNKTFDEAYTSLNPQSDSTKPAFTFEEYVDNKLWNNDNLVAYFKKK
jgi:hypothetical protein